MSRRIWPGALCEIRHAIDTPEMNGRFVIADRLCSVGDVISGKLLCRGVFPGQIWVVRSAVCGAPLPWANSVRGSGLVWVQERPVHENFLFPILPPPESETTEDRAPCEVETP